MSHMVADFGTLRGLLHHLAREYSGRPLAADNVPAPAAPLVAALGAVPPPPGARLSNYLHMPPSIGEQFAALAAAAPLQGLTLHVSPARRAALKAAAAAEAASAAEAGEEETWVSTNDALVAWLWRTLAALPCRGGAVVPFMQALDMRRRLPEAALLAAGEGKGKCASLALQTPRGRHWTWRCPWAAWRCSCAAPWRGAWGGASARGPAYLSHALVAAALLPSHTRAESCPAHCPLHSQGPCPVRHRCGAADCRRRFRGRVPLFAGPPARA